MNQDSDPQSIMGKLQNMPISFNAGIFKNMSEVQDFLYNSSFYNISQKLEYYEKDKFDFIINEINNFNLNTTNIIICGIKNFKTSQLYIFYCENKYFIINKIHFSKLKLFFSQISKQNQTNFFFLSSKQKLQFLRDMLSIGIEIDDAFNVFNDEFKSEINQLNDDFKFKINDKIFCIWKLIRKVFYAYLIKSSYYLTSKERNKCKEHLIKRQITDSCLNSSELVLIKKIEQNINLKCNIKDQKICVIKQQNPNKREKKCYDLFDYQHPFISKYLGKFKEESNSFIAIEYIEGKTLDKIDEMNLTFAEKIKIIGEIMIAVEYIHSKNIIIRDLKSKNIMIDSNHDAVLIDFDLSKIKEYDYDSVNTEDIGCIEFSAPEQYKSNFYSYKVDIYSIGALIYFIIMEESKISKQENQTKKFPDQFLFLEQIYNNCLKLLPEERPNISSAINDFLFKIQDSLKDGTIKTDENEIKENLTKLINIRFQFVQTIEKIEKNSFIDLSEIYYYFGDVFLNGIYMKKNIENSIKYFTFSSDLKNVKAQHRLGVIYINEQHVIRNVNKSIKYFTLAADQNKIEAQLNLGKIYMNIDIKKAIHYLMLAADQNNIEALFNLGMIYYNEEYNQKDINKAFKYFKSGADQNDHNSQLFIGKIYIQYNYILKDINKAIYYLKLSADQGNSDAQLILGTLYFDETFAIRDIRKAIYYLNLSSNQNNSDASFQLGLIYLKGINTPQNFDLAIHYFSLCHGDKKSDALLNLGYIYSNKNYKKQNVGKAIKCYKESINLGNLKPLFNLGLIYYDKSYNSFDINQAIYYLTLASNQNNSDAAYELGLIYYNGFYVVRDIPKARFYFSKSAEQKNASALSNLGSIYFTKNCEFFNVDAAIYYFILAADQGVSEAQFNLGLIYSTNEYNRYDIQKAIFYYEKQQIMAIQLHNTILQKFMKAMISMLKICPSHFII